MSKKTRREGAHKQKSANSDWPILKRQDGWKRISQSLPTANDQCEKDKSSGRAQAKVHQQRLTSVKKTRRVGAHKPKFTNSDWPMSKKTRQMGAHKPKSTNSDWPLSKNTRQVEAHKPKSTNSDWPVSKRQDEWKCTSQSPPTATAQCEKEKTSGNAQAKVHQQWLTNVKKTIRVGAHKSKSTNSDWPISKRQDGWMRTSPYYIPDRPMLKKTRRVGEHKPKSSNSDWPMSKKKKKKKKDKTSRSVQAKVHQQRLTSVKKTRRVKRTSQSPPTATDQCEKDKTSGNAQVKVHQQQLTSVKKTRRVGEHMPKFTNSDWPMSKKDKTSGSTQVKARDGSQPIRTVDTIDP